METLINFFNMIKSIPSYQIANIFISLMRTCARHWYICGPDKSASHTAIQLSIFKKAINTKQFKETKLEEKSQTKPVAYLSSVSW